METIAICICTYKRPEMLNRCILSLIKLTVLPEWNIIFIVVDNELEQNNKNAIEAFRNLTIFPIFYVHQPKKGIAAARNAALTAAEQHCSDWICFFDDDQYVKEDVLKNAMLAAKQYQAQVVKMFVQYIDSIGNELSISNDVCEGLVTETCATNGVLFDISLIGINQQRLRFDEKNFLTRGEDIEFFYRASLNGSKIIQINSAIVFEESTFKRNSQWYLLLDTFFHAAVSFRLYCKKKEIKKIAYALCIDFFRLYYLVELFRLPFLYFFSKALFHHKKQKILNRLFFSLGIVYGLFFFLPLHKPHIGY